VAAGTGDDDTDVPMPDGSDQATAETGHDRQNSFSGACDLHLSENSDRRTIRIGTQSIQGQEERYG